MRHDHWSLTANQSDPGNGLCRWSRVWQNYCPIAVRKLHAWVASTTKQVPSQPRKKERNSQKLSYRRRRMHLARAASSPTIPVAGSPVNERLPITLLSSNLPHELAPSITLGLRT
ncbi:hypothetical protein B9Z19DRAFT_1091856 [Tuber borchii]|uniref:Uncharacterized protein n=1 Tax=Tuber borchii TaxID=42251 RepID=A0A2T6ZH37_TUBBO|nr:hypothetical protein B9Z19DRAFT_1091856 [Tuber borchii]